MRPLPIILVTAVAIATVGAYVVSNNLLFGMETNESKPRAIITYIGERPTESTANWEVITVDGTTRSFALHVKSDTVVASSDGYGEIRAWAWMFCIGGRPCTPIKLELIDPKTDSAITDLLVHSSNGTYCQAYVLIRAQPGEYILRVSFADGNHLSKPIEVNEKNRDY